MRVQHREEGANEPAGIFSYQEDMGGETLVREGGVREEKDSFRIMADKDGVLYGRLGFRKTGKAEDQTETKGELGV